MKSKQGLIILIILVIVVAVFAAIVAAGGISFAGGNKVIIKGTVYYDIINKWGVTYDSCLIEEDGIFAVLWYMPWETKDIEITVDLVNGKTYSASVWTDRINLIAGSTGFSAEIRHVSDGIYQGKIYVYEVEKGFLWGEKTRVLQSTTGFEVDV